MKQIQNWGLRQLELVTPVLLKSLLPPPEITTQMLLCVSTHGCCCWDQMVDLNPLKNRLVKSQSGWSSSTFSFRSEEPWRECNGSIRLSSPGFPSRSRCCCLPAAWLHCIGSHTKKQTRCSLSQTDEHGGINLDGKPFTVEFICRSLQPTNRFAWGSGRQRWKCAWDSAVFAVDGASKCDGRSPVNRWPPLLSCVGCLGECAATGFY